MNSTLGASLQTSTVCRVSRWRAARRSPGAAVVHVKVKDVTASEGDFTMDDPGLRRYRPWPARRRCRQRCRSLGSCRRPSRARGLWRNRSPQSRQGSGVHQGKSRTSHAENESTQIGVDFEVNYTCLLPRPLRSVCWTCSAFCNIYVNLFDAFSWLVC